MTNGWTVLTDAVRRQDLAICRAFAGRIGGKLYISDIPGIVAIDGPDDFSIRLDADIPIDDMGDVITLTKFRHTFFIAPHTIQWEERKAPILCIHVRDGELSDEAANAHALHELAIWCSSFDDHDLVILPYLDPTNNQPGWLLCHRGNAILEQYSRKIDGGNQ